MQESAGEMVNLTVASCLMLLSHPQYDIVVSDRGSSSSSNRVFQCKTCSRKFSSFQALGGHRASHKRHPMPTESPLCERSSDSDGRLQEKLPPAAKPAKAHQCTVCGLEFSVGQALGGHMRRHRRAALRGPTAATAAAATTSGGGDGNDSSVSEQSLESSRPPTKKARVLSMDLNLTPYENNGKLLKLQLGTTSMVDFFL